MTMYKTGVCILKVFYSFFSQIVINISMTMANSMSVKIHFTSSLFLVLFHIYNPLSNILFLSECDRLIIIKNSRFHSNAIHEQYTVSERK